MDTTITPEMRQTAAADALDALRTLGREDMIELLWIDWRTRFTSRMGDALYATADDRVRKSSEKFRVNGTVCRARFSVPLWVRATPEERKNTVIHEICHLVAHHEAVMAGVKSIDAHGAEWKAVMRRAGVNPKRCHNVSTKGLGRKTIPATCGCDEHHVTPLVAGKILLGLSTYSCGRCKVKLTINESALTRKQLADCRAAGAKSMLKPKRNRRRGRRNALAALLG